MTHLKNIIIFVLLLLALGLTAKAQSTALHPYEGATHTYQWSGLAEGLNYAFYITADASGSTVLDDIAVGEFDFVNSPTGTVGTGESSASVSIAWNNGAALNAYYVWLKVANPGGCSNYRYVPVTPQSNAFDLLSENVPVDNTVSCPAIASTDGFDPLSTTYDPGATTLQFKVRRLNGTDNKLTPSTGDTYAWAFEPVLAVDPNWNLDISIVSVVGANSGTLVANASSMYTVDGLDDEVTITVSIKNLPGTTQDITMEIRNQTEVQTNLSDSDSGNDIVHHRIEIMPVINGMGGV